MDKARDIFCDKVRPHFEEMDDDVIFNIDPDELRIEIIGLLNNGEMQYLDELVKLMNNTINDWKADLNEDLKSSLKYDINNLIDSSPLDTNDIVEVLIECAYHLYYG